MSLAKIGKSPWNKGTKGISALTRQKMSQSKLGHVATNKNKPMNLEQKIKLSCANQGIKEAEFSGFTTSLSKIEREKLYKLNLHRECFERDNFMCQACNRQGGELNAHHVESWKFHPDLRYDINNLITLCKRCHKDFHSKFGSGSKTALKKKHLLLFKANKPQNKI